MKQVRSRNLDRGLVDDLVAAVSVVILRSAELWREEEQTFGAFITRAVRHAVDKELKLLRPGVHLPCNVDPRTINDRIPISLSTFEQPEKELPPAKEAAVLPSIISAETADALHRAVARELTKREAEIVRLKFGLDGRFPMTLEEIGARHGVTRERVRQILVKALLKLKRAAILLDHADP